MTGPENLFQTVVRGQFPQPGLAADELTGLGQVVERKPDDIDSAGSRAVTTCAAEIVIGQAG